MLLLRMAGETDHSFPHLLSMSRNFGFIRSVFRTKMSYNSSIFNILSKLLGPAGRSILIQLVLGTVSPRSSELVKMLGIFEEVLEPTLQGKPKHKNLATSKWQLLGKSDRLCGISSR